jgi:hypothetical protein
MRPPLLCTAGAPLRVQTTPHVPTRKEDIAGQHRTYTAYRFGFLWSTHDLFFWERELKQAKRGRWGPLYMNIWDALTIAGLRD